MEIFKNDFIKFRDEEENDYEIAVILFEKSIKLRVKNIDDFSYKRIIRY